MHGFQPTDYREHGESFSGYQVHMATGTMDFALSYSIKGRFYETRLRIELPCVCTWYSNHQSLDQPQLWASSQPKPLHLEVLAAMSANTPFTGCNFKDCKAKQ